MNINQKIYENILNLGILEILKEHNYIRMSAGGLMDLHIDKLKGEGSNLIIAIAHNGYQNGDVMADPDMEVNIETELKESTALSYQNDYMGVYRHVENISPTDAEDMNIYLEYWLRQIEQSNYKVVQLK